jgi:hypothetical protein
MDGQPPDSLSPIYPISQVLCLTFAYSLSTSCKDTRALDPPACFRDQHEGQVPNGQLDHQARPLMPATRGEMLAAAVDTLAPYKLQFSTGNFRTLLFASGVNAAPHLVWWRMLACLAMGTLETRLVLLLKRLPSRKVPAALILQRGACRPALGRILRLGSSRRTLLTHACAAPKQKRGRGTHSARHAIRTRRLAFESPLTDTTARGRSRQSSSLEGAWGGGAAACLHDWSVLVPHETHAHECEYSWRRAFVSCEHAKAALRSRNVSERQHFRPRNDEKHSRPSTYARLAKTSNVTFRSAAFAHVPHAHHLAMVTSNPSCW